MINRSTSISRKELFSGSMVIFIGLFYLVPSVLNLFHVKGYTLLWPELKMLLISVFYILSGSLFFFKKNVGWIMTAGVLLTFNCILIAIIFRMSQAGGLESFALMAILLFSLLVLAFLFIFSNNTRRKFNVNNKSYLLTIGVYLLLLAVNFLV